MATGQRTPETRTALWRVGLAVGLYAAVLAVSTGLLAARADELGLSPAGSRLRLGLCILAVELVFVAVFAPWLNPRGRGLRRRLGLSLLAPLLLVLAASVLVPAVVAGGVFPVAAVAWAQLYVGCVGAFFLSVTFLLRRLGSRPMVAQAATTALALVLLGSVLWVNGVIEALPTPGTKIAAARATVWTNPWLVAAGSILQADPLRSQRLYDWCIIGDYQFPVGYPAAGLGGLPVRAGAVSAGPLAAAGALLLLGRFLPRRAGAPQRPD
jgi:hypothetical protein